MRLKFNSARLCTSSAARSLLAGMALLLAACSAATFIYNRADALVGHYFEGLVSLQSDQRTQLRAWLKSDLQWHRDSQIDRYVQFLANVDRQLAAPLPVGEYDRARLELEGFIADIAAHAAPGAITLLQGLSRPQLDELYASLEQDERKRAEKATRKSVAGLREDREAAAIRTLTRWTGAATEPQKKIVHESIAQIEFIDRLQEQARAQWRQSLRQAVETLQTTGNQRPLQQVLLHPEQSYPQEYRAREHRNMQTVLHMLASLDQSLTVSQRGKLRAQVRGLAKDIEGLGRN